MSDAQLMCWTEFYGLQLLIINFVTIQLILISMIPVPILSESPYLTL